MSRPLIQYGVGQLEEMFAKSAGNLSELKKLQSELRHRQVPRAVALLEKVEAAIRGSGGAAPGTPQASPTSGSLFPPPPAPPPPPSMPPAASTPAPSAPAPAAEEAISSISIEDAYKLLKASPGSSWESVESTRRHLIDRSSPSKTSAMTPAQRSQVMGEAQRINAAYLALAAHRVKGSFGAN